MTNYVNLLFQEVGLRPSFLCLVLLCVCNHLPDELHPDKTLIRLVYLPKHPGRIWSNIYLYGGFADYCQPPKGETSVCQVPLNPGETWEHGYIDIVPFSGTVVIDQVASKPVSYMFENQPSVPLTKEDYFVRHSCSLGLLTRDPVGAKPNQFRLLYFATTHDIFMVRKRFRANEKSPLQNLLKRLDICIGK